jgi:superfamily II DNA or RNA helicase
VGEGILIMSEERKITLRPYQEAAVEAVSREWEEGKDRVLIVLPTGTGKTIVFSTIAFDRAHIGRVLILAHRGELLEQAADKLKRSTGLVSSLEKAESTCLGSWNRVTVGSVQTLQRPARLERFAPDYFSTIIIDEAHHALSDGYQAVLSYFSGAKVLGVTATPDRGDMRNLGQYFDALAYEYTLPQAIKDGYLCKIKALTIPLKIDMAGVGVEHGDYKAGDIGTALDPYLEQIADEMAKVCKDRRTVVFLPLVATSQKFRDVLEEKGFRAAEVNGESSDRKEVLADFDAGKYDVLCNSMLLTEGWDCPAVDCVVVLRPTKVRGLYCQMVGRGTRLSPGKDHLLLLDFLWMTEKHELCRPAALITGDAEVAAQMTKDMEEGAGEAFDLEEAEVKASEDVVAQREEALAKQLAEMRKRKRKLVDPLQFEMSIQAEDLAGYVPSFGWEMAPPTDKQKQALERRGIYPEEIENAGKAAKILDRLEKRQAEGLSTPKQIRFLEGRGFRHVGQWEFEAARRIIDRIAGNGWRVPYEINPKEYIPPKGDALLWTATWI